MSIIFFIISFCVPRDNFFSDPVFFDLLSVSGFRSIINAKNSPVMGGKRQL